MKKIISIFVFICFFALITFTSFHIHKDIKNHDDCAICLAGSLLHSNLIDSTHSLLILVDSSYFNLQKSTHIPCFLILNLSSRAPPVL